MQPYGQSTNVTNCKETLRSAVETVLGTSQGQAKIKWFDQKCKDLADRKNKAHKHILQRKSSAIDKYKGLGKKASRLCRNKTLQSFQNMMNIVEV